MGWIGLGFVHVNWTHKHVGYVSRPNSIWVADARRCGFEVFECLLVGLSVVVLQHLHTDKTVAQYSNNDCALSIIVLPVCTAST